MATSATDPGAPLSLERGARREQILEQALALISEQGIHAVSTRKIATAVGISQPSLYAFFPTRQALVAEVSRRAFSALSARMSDELSAPTTAGLLRRLARAYIDFGLTHPDAYRVAFMIEGVRRAAGSEHDAALGAGLTAFRILRNATARSQGSDATADEIDIIAQSTWASLHGLVSLLIARPNFHWADRERLIETHLRRLIPD
jgi:AcrR family transcriptional regulator